MYALIIDGAVRQLFDRDPQLDGMGIRSVRGVKGIDVGWRVDAHGVFSPPPPLEIPADEIPARIRLMTRRRMDALFIQSDGDNVATSALAYFNRLASSQKLSESEKADLVTFRALDDWQEAIRLAGERLVKAADYAAACDEKTGPSLTPPAPFAR